MDNLEKECLQRWKKNDFYEVLPSTPELIHPVVGEWVQYEEYMRAILIDCVPGRLGKLLVRFPANATEDNCLHTHPASDRVVTVIEGGGDFICYHGRSKKVKSYPLFPGIRVWMPRGILHTFKSRGDGLLVESLHNPFIPLESPHCLVYPKKEIF